MSRILIIRGCLALGGLDYPLTCEDGSAFTGDYRGPGWVTGDRLRAGDPMGAMFDFTIGPATPESIDWRDGNEAGKAQQRCRFPRGKSEAYVAGWRQAWQDRGRLVPGGSAKAEWSARKWMSEAGS